MHAVFSAMEIVRAVQHLFGVRPHAFFLTITFLGASVTLWTLLILYHWLVDPKFGRRLGIVLAVSIITNQLLKGVFGTSRPYDLDAALSTESARHTGGGHGFPSGHTQNAATFWPAFAFRYGRTWFWIVAILIVFAVALSRIYLGVHMPIDVTGGFIFGMIFAWVAGSWSGPRPRPEDIHEGNREGIGEDNREGIRWLWGPLVGIGGLALALFGVANGSACGLLAGCFMARPVFEPPRTVKGRVTIVAGGLAVLALLGFLLGWLPWRFYPGLIETTPAQYFLGLVLALVAFDLWPWLWQRWIGRSEEGSVRS
jgi:membrane-associated phospholipid phosphatase